MSVEQKIHDTAEKVGQEVRGYVRDRFTPGDLGSLDELAAHVQFQVKLAIADLRGAFDCNTCRKSIEVRHVNCSECTMVGR